MDREWLASQLDQGRSIESIAREAGRSASTVGYWVKKHGLRSAHAERHAGRGGVDRPTLERLVSEGRTVRGMADTLGVSPSTIRHWLRQHDLQTARQARYAATVVLEHRPVRLVRTCPRHGKTVFARIGTGHYRCRRCRAERVTERRRRMKLILVAEAGGRCRICGYDRYAGALQFHHPDPAVKRFAISLRGVTRALDVLRAEARKCVLLCGNCHAEVEAGLATIPGER